MGKAIDRPEAAKRVRQICSRLAYERGLQMTQREMAAELETRQAHISAIETFRFSPMMETVIAMAQTLGLDLAVVAPHHRPLLELSEEDAAQALALLAQKPPFGPAVNVTAGHGTGCSCSSIDIQPCNVVMVEVTEPDDAFRRFSPHDVLGW